MAVIFLPVVEVVVSLTKFKLNAAPSPTFPPATVESALVVVLPLWVALASKLPTLSSVPLPIVAIVSLLTMFNATDGLTAIFPAAPVITLVVLLLSEVAVNVNFPAPVRLALSCNDASARLLVLSNAKATPTPTFGGCLGSEDT